MLSLLTRRLVARCVRAPPSSLRYTSTKSGPEIKTKPRVKSQIIEAFTNPAPPILARWPNVHWGVRVLIYGTGAGLAAHIWSEYFFTLGHAEGISMMPTFNGTGDWLLLSKKYRRGRYIEVGDIVSFKHPIDEGTMGVKRVIGMPGDFVLRDSPDTSGVMIQVPEGHCYIVGDNMTWSRDSRIFGPLPLALIKAKVTGMLRTVDEFAWYNIEDVTNGLQPYKDEDVD